MKIASILYVSDMLNESTGEYEKIAKAFPNYGFEISIDDKDFFMRLLDEKNKEKKHDCIVYDNTVRDIYSMGEGGEEGLYKLSMTGLETISFLKGLQYGGHTDFCMDDGSWVKRLEMMELIPTEKELIEAAEAVEKHRKEYGLPMDANYDRETDDSPALRLSHIMDPEMPVFMLTWPRIDIRSRNDTAIVALSKTYEKAMRYGVIRNYGNAKDVMGFLSHPVVTF